MSWRPLPEDDEQVAVIRRALAKAIRAAGLSRREIDRRVGWTENYISQMLRNAADLKLVHVAAVLRVLGIKPADFYGTLFERSEKELSHEDILTWYKRLEATTADLVARIEHLEDQLRNQSLDG